jgi:hypothetical protein
MPKKATRPKRGRPEHVPTLASRRKVSIAAGGGMTHEQIAMALGLHVDTLRKHYQQDLSEGANMRRMEVLQSQYQAAMKKGSTAAARTYLASLPEFEVLPQGEGEGQQAPAAPPPPAPAPRPAALGKKEQAAADAATATHGTDWDGLLPKPGTPLQ